MKLTRFAFQMCHDDININLNILLESVEIAMKKCLVMHINHLDMMAESRPFIH